jgi:uncharacterized protein YqjF (DUF2071 family)
MAQSWHDLLFAHWPIDASLLRPHRPPGLTIDTFEGQAWIAVVPFRMSGVRLRETPALPGLSAFPELNVRTYVVADHRPGVWFFSLDAGSSVAVAIARARFHLPYFRARMKCEKGDGWIKYASERTHRGARPAILEAKYRPVGGVFEAQRGTLEHFLTERYCLYSTDSRGSISCGEISSCTLAIASRRSAISKKLHDRSRRHRLNIAPSIATLRAPPGCRSLESACP